MSEVLEAALDEVEELAKVVQRVTEERDKAREDCGWYRKLYASASKDRDLFFRKWKEAEAADSAGDTDLPPVIREGEASKEQVEALALAGRHKTPWADEWSECLRFARLIFNAIEQTGWELRPADTEGDTDWRSVVQQMTEGATWLKNMEGMAGNDILETMLKVGREALGVLPIYTPIDQDLDDGRKVLASDDKSDAPQVTRGNPDLRIKAVDDASAGLRHRVECPLCDWYMASDHTDVLLAAFQEHVASHGASTPDRSYIEHPAERAIQEAVDRVEEMGASEELTAIVIALGKLRKRVAAVSSNGDNA